MKKLILFFVQAILLVACQSIIPEDNGCSFDEYLELKCYDVSEMTPGDIEIFCQAYSRIRVVKAGSHYKTRQKSCKEVNMSEQLFSLVQSVVTSTYNYPAIKPHRGFTRTKTGLAEGHGEDAARTDCFGIALSIMMPNWEGLDEYILSHPDGINSGDIESFISENGLNCSISNTFPSADYQADDEVVWYCLDGNSSGHAVNLYAVTTDYLICIDHQNENAVVLVDKDNFRGILYRTQD